MELSKFIITQINYKWNGYVKTNPTTINANHICKRMFHEMQAYKLFMYLRTTIRALICFTKVIGGNH